jgi:hypothetical protein
MFHRVEEYIFDVPGKIFLILDGMFPETPLPDSSLPLLLMRLVTEFPWSDPIQIFAGKQPFDFSPAHGKIGVPVR